MLNCVAAPVDTVEMATNSRGSGVGSHDRGDGGPGRPPRGFVLDGHAIDRLKVGDELHIARYMLIGDDER